MDERQPLLDSDSSEVEMGKNGKKSVFTHRHTLGNPRENREIKSSYACSPDLSKALMAILCVLTTLAGAAVVGFGVTALWTPEYQPTSVMDRAPSLWALTQSLSILGGILIILSLIGCVGVVSNSSRCTLWHSVLTVMCIVAQVVIGGFTLFVRTQILLWSQGKSKPGCMDVDCEREFTLAFCMLTPAAGFLLGCIILQGLLLYLSFVRKRQLDYGTDQSVVPGEGVDPETPPVLRTPANLKARDPSITIKVIPPTPAFLKENMFNSNSGDELAKPESPEY